MEEYVVVATGVRVVQDPVTLKEVVEEHLLELQSRGRRWWRQWARWSRRWIRIWFRVWWRCWSL
jgi:hypothetical protein